MEHKNCLANEVKSWLEVILKNENLRDLSVNIVSNSEKGDGFSGDILFADAFATIANGDTKKYNFAIKCSKDNEALRTNVPISDVYANEIYIYEKVLPTFTQFQLEKGIDKVFDSMPKCYGTLIKQNREIIVFENLKSNGYVLWNKKKPLTRKHIEMVIGEYGKWHAISVAMQAQQPGKFQEVVGLLKDNFKIFSESMISIFEKCVIELGDLLKNELNDGILNKWKGLKPQMNDIFNRLLQTETELKVITHGDCWNNNFLFKHNVKDSEVPDKVAILDWQISSYKSPVVDLSYFIFACISKTDLDDLESILQCYHNSFSNFLVNLGSDPEVLYPFQQFLADWKKFCRFGIVMSSLTTKVCSSDEDEIFDMAERIQDGKKMSEIFNYSSENKEPYKDRMKFIVKYVVEHELI